MEFISTTQDSTFKTMTIAAVSEEKRHGGDNYDFEQVKPDMPVEDRYYKTNDYKSLSVEKKKGLQLKRKNRGQHPKNAKNGPLPKSKMSDITLFATSCTGAPCAESDTTFNRNGIRNCNELPPKSPHQSSRPHHYSTTFLIASVSASAFLFLIGRRSMALLS
jgi:hypothetical protein